MVGRLEAVGSLSLETTGQDTMKSKSNDAYRQFQRMLVEVRQKSGLSQQEVADRLGRPQTYVSKCELGTRRMDVIEFVKFAKVVGFDPAVFIKKLKSK